MTIEIHTPELERLVREEMPGGAFQSVDDVLIEALKALREKRAKSKSLKLPARPLGDPGALPRRDIYDDAR